MKTFFLFLFFLPFSLASFSGNVSIKEAESVAKSHFYQSVNSFDNKSKVGWDDIILNNLVNPSISKSNSFYVFNVNDSNGFVIVSSTKSIKPVLAYSVSAGFNKDNIAPGQQKFLDYFNSSIRYAVDNDIKAEASVLQKWEELLMFKPENGFKQKETVAPLLGDIKWNQTWPYNAHCPEDPNAFQGGNGHVPVGCVATSMLQVMKYYNWPQSGQGFIHHNTYANGGYPSYTINYNEANYNWNNIPNSASGDYNYDLAKINLHAAVSVTMRWGPHGSASNTSRVANALRNNFLYSEDVEFIEKEDFSYNQWTSKLRSQIDNKKPMVYSGRPIGESYGHAWNCDGYQGSSYFHMNWGWGGSGDGFYTLDNLNSSSTPGGEENNFVDDQRAVINIYPKGDFPEYCSGKTIITGTEGSFNDGSSTSNYLKNSSCIYVINPECGASVNIEFPRFDLAAGSQVKVYDGDESSDLLIATFDKDNMPKSSVAGTKGAITIVFETNDKPTASGWEASYTVNYCVNGILYTEASENFGDGSGKCDYEPSTVCFWEINPEGADYIKIDFEKFDLAGGADFVEIYKNSMASANSVGHFTAFNPPEETLVIESNHVYVRFFSDSGPVASGWKLSYSSGISNIEDQNIIDNVSIAPNPGSENAKLSIYSKTGNIANISIYNPLGQVLNRQEINLAPGNNEIVVTDIFNDFRNNSLYLINILIDNNSHTERFIFEEN